MVIDWDSDVMDLNENPVSGTAATMATTTMATTVVFRGDVHATIVTSNGNECLPKDGPKLVCSTWHMFICGFEFLRLLDHCSADMTQ